MPGALMVRMATWLRDEEGRRFESGHPDQVEARFGAGGSRHCRDEQPVDLHRLRERHHRAFMRITCINATLECQVRQNTLISV